MRGRGVEGGEVKWRRGTGGNKAPEKRKMGEG